jgi:hypothetical protein
MLDGVADAEPSLFVALERQPRRAAVVEQIERTHRSEACAGIQGTFDTPTFQHPI